MTYWITRPDGRARKCVYKIICRNLCPTAAIIESEDTTNECSVALHWNSPHGVVRLLGPAWTWLLIPALSSCVSLDRLLTSLSQFSFLLNWTKNIYHLELLLGLVRSCFTYLSQCLAQSRTSEAAVADSTHTTATVSNTNAAFASITL